MKLTKKDIEKIRAKDSMWLLIPTKNPDSTVLMEWQNRTPVLSEICDLALKQLEAEEKEKGEILELHPAVTAFVVRYLGTAKSNWFVQSSLRVSQAYQVRLKPHYDGYFLFLEKKDDND